MLKRNAGREGRGGGEERGECVMREYGGVVNAEAKQDNYVLQLSICFVARLLSVLCVCVHMDWFVFLCVQPHILALQSVLAGLHYPVGWAGTFCQGESSSSHTHPDHSLVPRPSPRFPSLGVW